MTLQETYNIKRAEYMAVPFEQQSEAHQIFYRWLAKEIHITSNDLPVTLEKLKASTDKHFNDIPLHLWDRLDNMVRYKAGIYGMKSWTLGDSVCVLKAFARQLVENNT